METSTILIIVFVNILSSILSFGIGKNIWNVSYPAFINFEDSFQRWPFLWYRIGSCFDREYSNLVFNRRSDNLFCLFTSTLGVLSLVATILASFTIIGRVGICFKFKPLPSKKEAFKIVFK